MKKLLYINFLFIITLSYSQEQVAYEAIWLNDGMEEQYLEVETFWSEIKKEAISRDLQNGWVVWKVVKDPENESHSKKPDYIVMNGYKDSDQREKQINWEELGMEVYKGKLSKSKYKKEFAKWQGTRKKTSRFLVERLDNTEWKIPPGSETKVYFNGFQALNDDYENYEMKFFKKWHEKRMETGDLGWWEFNKVISRSDNENQDVTHFTMDIALIDNYMGSYQQPTEFSDQMLMKHGSESRKRIIGDELELKFVQFPQN
jgi:hypothetical protein